MSLAARGNIFELYSFERNGKTVIALEYNSLR